MIDVAKQERFTSDISNYIISRVVGTHPNDEIVCERPNKLYIAGTLAAKKNLEEDKNEDQKAASIRASMLKVSILIKRSDFEKGVKVTLKPTGNVFYKIKNTASSKDPTNVDEEGKQESKKHLWKGISYTDNYTVNLYEDPIFNIDFSDAQKRANTDPLITNKIPSDLWNAEISVMHSDYGSDDVLVSFIYKNTSIESDETDNFERTLFDCKLKVEIGDLCTKEFVDEYFYEGHKQRYFYDFRTMNCQAKWLDKDRKCFTTDHYSRFEQQNIRPRENLPGVNLTFSNLMSDGNAVSSLNEFINEMKKYNNIYKKNIPLNVLEDEFEPRNGNRQRTWGERKDLANNFDKLIKRVEKGFELIKSNTFIKESFIKTNETFNNYYTTKDSPIENAGWRLFQLAFFLSTIESVTEEHDLDVTDVLHVDTGGGKSEAYFALVVFTSFYERSIGKKNGVSSIVKFPLRMLSIQQLERISGIIIHAENVRKQYQELFLGSPFSLGYYVGSKGDDFPHYYSKIKYNLYEGKKLKSPAPYSKIISICPLCPPNSKGVMRLKADEEHKRIIHECDKCGKQYYIYQSDREIFRWRPTVIVSTVDKWAGLSQQRRARNLLGGNGSMCPDGHGFIPSGDQCEEKTEEDFQCSNVGKNLIDSDGPRISIQDEMHLLKEGFGTISSHFEGLIEAIVENGAKRKLKHIAMSATLNGAEKQIKELYNKNFFVIPGRCPEGVGSQNDFFFEKKNGPKRIIYGLKPNLRDNHYASLRSLLHFAEFIISAQKELNTNPSNFCNKYGLNDNYEAQSLLNQYLVPLTYHIKKQDAYDMGRLKDAVISDTLKEDEYNGSDLQGTVLTGDSGLEELKDTIDKVRDFVINYDPTSFSKNGIMFEPIFATSVVSHGVDLDELNFMTFQGLPYSTSEYIQALSRVGRKNLGMILLWFYPNRVRDESFYRNFTRYHDSLDHEVRPIPINRSSELGLKQTINSIFCAGIINYLSNKNGKPLYKKKDILNLNSNDIEDLISFIDNVYGEYGINKWILEEVESRLNEIKLGKDSGNEYFPKILAKSGNPYFRTQSGMRGMQKTLALGLKANDKRMLEKMGE